MKKTLLITILALFSLVTFGQERGPLKFLGIPIDGTEAQFGSKLKAKGFTYSTLSESYEGQFNGQSVDIYIHTNHNKVDRVYVAFPFTNEESIKNEFNRLLGQFQETGKYKDFSMNEEIPQSEDISHEISVNNKRYQASFSYFDSSRDPVELMNALLDKFSGFFTEEQLATLKEYAAKALDAPDEQKEALQAELMTEMQKLGFSQEENEEVRQERFINFVSTYIDGMRSLADGDVWFMIHEIYGQYQIGLYYDNLHNQAHGEDL